MFETPTARNLANQQTDWLAIDGGLTLDDGRVLAMRELLDLTATARGRFVRLGEDDYLILSNALRRRLDKLCRRRPESGLNLTI